SINVEASAALTVQGTHMYSCPDYMWNGINVNSGGGITGRVVLTGYPDFSAGGTGSGWGPPGTFIEDAYSAVTIISPLAPNSWATDGYFLKCDNTIFNCNWHGITISNYSPAASTVGGSY